MVSSFQYIITHRTFIITPTTTTTVNQLQPPPLHHSTTYLDASNTISTHPSTTTIHQHATTITHNENAPKQCKTRCLGPRWSFFFFYVIFLILTNVLYYFQILSTSLRVQKDGDNKNGPKRCETRPLDPRWVFSLFFFFLCFCVFDLQSDVLLFFSGTNYVVKGSGGRGQRKQVQMTWDASFGP